MPLASNPSSRISETAVVVLAAGASTRLGMPKQTLLLNGETLLDRTLRIAHLAGFTHIVVVLGAFAEIIQNTCDLKACKVVINSDWASGMGSSVRAAIPELTQASGAILTTCDMPFVTAEHLRQLVATGTLTASRYTGATGVPAYFPRTYFPALSRLHGNGGAKQLLAHAKCVDLLYGEIDVDTPEDVLLMQAKAAEERTS